MPLQRFVSNQTLYADNDPSGYQTLNTVVDAVNGVVDTVSRLTPPVAAASMVACRQRPVPDAIATDTTANSLNSRMVCFAPTGANLTDIVVALPGFGFNNPEADIPQAMTITAAIEYPVGTFTQVFAKGASSLTVTPGRALYAFDPCPISIPAGAKFFVKVYATWTLGTLWLTARTASYSAGEWTVRGTGLSDQTLTATTQTSTDGNGLGAVVYGRLSLPVPCLGILGDSISMTAADNPDPTTGAEFLERAMLGMYPAINLARSSDSFSLYQQRYEGRAAILRDHITHLIMAYGRNDMNDSQPLSTVQGNMQKTLTPFLTRGVKVWGVTVTPYTSSTDGWVTAANQTIVTFRETSRIAYNAWLRANWRSLGLTGLLDWAHVVDPTDSGKWLFDVGASGRSASGFATMSGGGIASVAYGNYNGLANSVGTSYSGTNIRCVVTPFPGETGGGAAVVANQSSGFVNSYTVTAAGSGYRNAPMIAPISAWTNDGIHPSSRGYAEIISQCGIGPNMLLV